MACNLDPLGLVACEDVAEISPKYHGIEDADLNAEVDLDGVLGFRKAKISDIISKLNFIYKNTVGCEFEYIRSDLQKDWLAGAVESAFTTQLSKDEKVKVLKEIIRTERFEQFLHKRFPGAKRFSIEGGDVAIPVIEKIIDNSARNGVKKIVEIKIGYDGIVLANSALGKKYSLTKQQVFLALAEKVPNKKGELVNNYYQKWNEIDAKLPKINIAIYGPPSTSGTRDAFVELVMEPACINMKEFVETYPDKNVRKKKCHVIRSDGRFIEAGENDNLIVQKLKNDHDALGVFGFSFLEENKEVIQAALINQVQPSFNSIISGQYEVSRPLFIYFKKEHLDLIPQMREFIMEIVGKDTIGPDGYLLQKGLIPLTIIELKKVRDETINNL